MRGKKAKALRRKAYGDFSIRVKEYYTKNGTVYSKGRRALYKALTKQ